MVDVCSPSPDLRFRGSRHERERNLFFLCKNVNTCNYVLNELLVKQGADIVFLQ